MSASFQIVFYRTEQYCSEEDHEKHLIDYTPAVAPVKFLIVTSIRYHLTCTNTLFLSWNCWDAASTNGGAPKRARICHIMAQSTA